MKLKSIFCVFGALLLSATSAGAFLTGKSHDKSGHAKPGEYLIAVTFDQAMQAEITKATSDYFSANKKQSEICQPLHPGNYHITLLSVGSVDDAKIPELIARLRDVAENNSAFDWSFHSMDLFEKALPPALVLSGKTTPPLAKLQTDIRKAVLELGLANYNIDAATISVLPPPRFNAHITTARCSGTAPDTKLKQLVSGKPLHITSFTMLLSEQPEADFLSAFKTSAVFRLAGNSKEPNL